MTLSTSSMYNNDDNNNNNNNSYWRSNRALQEWFGVTLDDTTGRLT